MNDPAAQRRAALAHRYHIDRELGRGGISCSVTSSPTPFDKAIRLCGVIAGTNSLQIDWKALLVPSVHLGEIFLRGTVIYLFIFFALRMLRREAGSIGISDLLVIVLKAAREPEPLPPTAAPARPAGLQKQP